MTQNKPKILIIYKSSTGFTKKYAGLLAEKLDCRAINFKNIRSVSLSSYDMLIFGTRAHAGSIDGLKRFRKILKQTGSRQLFRALFVTGAVPAAEKDAIQQLWQNNLTESERTYLPHFYLPAGLCYEKMSFTDRIMMKGLFFMMKRKKDKTAKDLKLEKQIAHSFDISSEEYLKPVIECVLGLI